MKCSKIILDFDNTIARSAETILGMYGYECDPQVLEWDFSPYAKNDEESKEMVDKFQCEEFWEKLEPMDGFKEWIAKQFEEGFDIYVCSRRFIGQFSKVINWMNEQDLDKYIKDYIFIYKSFDTKTMLLDKETFIIDDNPKCFGTDEEAYKIRIGKYKYADSYNNFEMQVDCWSKMPIITYDPKVKTIMFRR